MSKPYVLITRQIPASGLELLQGTCDLKIWHEDSVVTQDWLLEHIGRAEGVFCLLTDQMNRSVLEEGVNLKVVSTMAVGFDHINVAECTRRGIPVGHTPGVLTETTADFACCSAHGCSSTSRRRGKLRSTRSLENMESDVISWARSSSSNVGESLDSDALVKRSPNVQRGLT